MTTTEFDKQNSEFSFAKIMKFKGEIAPIAEKACRNLELKIKNCEEKFPRAYYFAIGHAIKSMLNNKEIFDFRIEDGKAQQFKHLSEESFNEICKQLETVVTENTKKEYSGLIPSIRNLNNHYIHCFNGIKLDAQKNKLLITFIKECFHVALIQVYIKENNIDYDKEKLKNKELVEFLFERFKNKKNKDFWPHINELSLNEAIEAILFVKVEKENFTFKIIKNEELNIASGMYLSFYGCLFLLSLFLYTNEAELLISKIYGFKKQEEKEDRSKRNLFTYFCKKTSSRDSETETPDLVCFRDIIGDLNKYPTQWNKEYEIESETDKSPLLAKLKSRLIELEIDKIFFRAAEYNDPDIDKNELAEARRKFGIYARYEIWEIGKAKNINGFTDNEIEKFRKLIYDHATQRDAEEKLVLIEEQKAAHPDRSYEAEEARLKEIVERCEAEGKTSEEYDRIKTRLDGHEYFRSQGRNKDRFMLFAMRFLAETDYFGSDVKFKVYEYYSPEINKNKIGELKKELPKKEYDKRKFHNGHLVGFYTWQEHRDRNKGFEWYTPFVVQNNAVQVQLTFNKENAPSGLKTITIQRNVIVYFLQHALRSKDESIAGKGYSLLNDYYTAHANEYNTKKENLHQIQAEDKAAYKKLFPKRLLQTASPQVFERHPEPNYLQALLDKATQAEDRYKALYEKAPDKALFEKRNKGRQFKLSFIRSAWNWMYFKDIYNKQVARENNTHHKRFHITRDEFNEFSRLMFGMDTNVIYCRKKLSAMFKPKHFFDNKEFESLFNAAESFSDLYYRTKKRYTDWLTQHAPKQKGTYTLESYKEWGLMEGQLFFINTGHFIAFLKDKCEWKTNEVEVPIFEALTDNGDKLIAEFYANTPKNQSLKSRKAHYETKREDALLYDIALYYLRREFLKHNQNLNADIDSLLGQKTSVTQLLTTKVTYKVKDIYSVEIPMNNLDAFLDSVARKQDDEELHGGNSFMANLQKYMAHIYKTDKDKENKIHPDIFDICQQLNDKKQITFDQYQKINHHLLVTSNKLTRISMAMEKYFLEKSSHVIGKMKRSEETGCSFIDFDNTNVPQAYFGKGDYSIRNKAAHFLVPANKSYIEHLKELETLFINEKIKQYKYTSFDAIRKEEKTICELLVETLYADKKEIVEGKPNKESAQKWYFNEKIKV